MARFAAFVALVLLAYSDRAALATRDEVMETHELPEALQNSHTSTSWFSVVKGFFDKKTNLGLAMGKTLDFLNYNPGVVSSDKWANYLKNEGGLIQLRSYDDTVVQMVPEKLVNLMKTGELCGALAADISAWTHGTFLKHLQKKNYAFLKFAFQTGSVPAPSYTGGRVDCHLQPLSYLGSFIVVRADDDLFGTGDYSSDELLDLIFAAAHKSSFYPAPGVEFGKFNKNKFVMNSTW